MKHQLLFITLLALLPAVAHADVVSLEPDEAFMVPSSSSLERLGMTVPCYIANCDLCYVATECQVCGNKGNCCSEHCTHCSNDTCSQCAQKYNLNMGLCALENGCIGPNTACAHCDA
jgi:hypothetical protein